ERSIALSPLARRPLIDAPPFMRQTSPAAPAFTASLIAVRSSAFRPANSEPFEHMLPGFRACCTTGWEMDWPTILFAPTEFGSKAVLLTPFSRPTAPGSVTVPPLTSPTRPSGLTSPTTPSTSAASAAVAVNKTAAMITLIDFMYDPFICLGSIFIQGNLIYIQTIQILRKPQR